MPSQGCLAADMKAPDSIRQKSKAVLCLKCVTGQHIRPTRQPFEPARPYVPVRKIMGYPVLREIRTAQRLSARGSRLQLFD